MPSELSSISMLSRISSSSSMMRTVPLLLDIHRSLSHHRKLQFEGRSLAWFTLDRNIPTVFLHNPVADGQAEPGPFASGLCGEKRIVDLFDVFVADAASGVLQDNFDFGID